MYKKYKVKIRRGKGFSVKPEAERLDGKEFLLRQSFEITNEHSELYIGEFAMAPAYDDKDWPEDGITWIASGDLIEILSKEPTPKAYSTRNKTLDNINIEDAIDNIPDLEIYGNGDTFKLICKVSSKKEGWMKSTKAMEIPYVGCVIQVTTQQGDNIAEALTFVPGTKIMTIKGEDGAYNKIVGT